MERYYLMAMEFQFWKIKKVLEKDDGDADGCTTL